MSRGNSRSRGAPGNWLDGRAKYLVLALTAVATLALIVVAMNQAPVVNASVVPRTPSFGNEDATATKGAAPIAAFIGDSYTHGTGATDLDTHRWSSLVSQANHWSEVNLGRGGTGFVTTSSNNGCGLDYCPNYQEMVPAAVAATPDVVFVAGGQNDFRLWSSDRTRVVEGIASTYNSLRAALPDARIIIVGPSTTASVISPKLTEMDAAVQSAASAIGAGYVSLIDPVVFSRDMILPDGGHVNDAGHAAIARAILAVIGQ